MISPASRRIAALVAACDNARPLLPRARFALHRIALALALPLPVGAQEIPSAAEAATTLETIIVEASPFRRGAEELVQPVDVIAGEELERRRGGTIGDVLADRPGVANASFGPGVGRPVIRGQGGPRVQILDNGISSMDASSISADHAVSVDPTQAEQIEIIKGPATLIYGGGASAGIVNVVDDRLPDRLSPGLRLGGGFSYGSNADEKTSTVKARYGLPGLQLGAQYGHRSAGDFSVPGYAQRQYADGDSHDDHDHEHEHEHGTDSFNILDNSSLRSESFGASAAWIGESGMLGAAVTRFDTHYGVPGHSHAHEDEHEEAHDEDEAHSHDGVRIDLQQTRVDLRGLLRAPLPGFSALESRVGINDYQHQEIEADGDVGTRFDVQETEARVQLTHLPLGGWTGVGGVQIGDRDFKAVGAEAFIPPVSTRGLGLFLVEQRALGAHRLELGARVDQTRHAPTAAADGPLARLRKQDFTALSLSAGAAFALAEHLHLRVNAQHAQRAPSAEELYAYGAHLATSSFERGAQDLDAETANNLELTLGRDAGRFTWELSAFYNRINDYVFLSETDLGLNADGSGSAQSDGMADRVDEAGRFAADGELLLLDYRQRDAEFHGAELTAGYRLIDRGALTLDLRVFGDTVRGRLRNGDNLPRMTPMRAGIGADAAYRGLNASLRYLRADRQDRTAALETDTPGYDLVSADLGYSFAFGSSVATLFVRGRNLLDEKQRLSTSVLKDVAPQPGRSIYTGIRIDFQPPA